MKTHTAHWSRAALAAAALIAGGGALAQGLPPYITGVQNPAPASSGIPPDNDGTPGTAPALVVNSTNSTATLGYNLTIGPTTVQDLLDQFSMPLPTGVPVAVAGFDLDLTIPVNSLQFTANLHLPGTPPTAVLGTAPTSFNCSLDRIAPTPAVSVPCANITLTASGATFDFGASTEGLTNGETWHLNINYVLPNPTGRHALQLTFGGDMDVLVTDQATGGTTPILNQTFTFPGPPGNLIVYNPLTGATTNYAIPGGSLTSITERIGPVAAHQPALIATSTPQVTVPPGGGDASVTATFTNQGTAASTSISYTATNFPMGTTLVPNSCTYIITPPGGTPSAAPACSMTGNTVNLGTWPATVTIPAGAAITFNFTVNVPGTATLGGDIEHLLLGSAGSNPVRTNVSGSLLGSYLVGAKPPVVAPMAFGQAGTQSVPTLGPLALGGMGLMVALVPGFIARRRKAAGQ